MLSASFTEIVALLLKVLILLRLSFFFTKLDIGLSNWAVLISEEAVHTTDPTIKLIILQTTPFQHQKISNVTIEQFGIFFFLNYMWKLCYLYRSYCNHKAFWNRLFSIAKNPSQHRILFPSF